MNWTVRSNAALAATAPCVHMMVLSAILVKAPEVVQNPLYFLFNSTGSRAKKTLLILFLPISHTNPTFISDQKRSSSV
jgi:hypothetical protein